MTADQDDDVAAFEQGYSAGLHPQAGDGPGDGVTTTTTLSAWLALTCQTCRHTFRVGDRVLVAGAQVRHLDPRLRCASVEDESDDDAAVAAFAVGLLESWPIASGAPVRLTADSWQVARPDRTVSATCPVCAHTFRPGDMVILCPCAGSVSDPDRMRCELTVHRDPVSGLTCWDDWKPSGRMARCPITHEALT